MTYMRKTMKRTAPLSSDRHRGEGARGEGDGMAAWSHELGRKLHNSSLICKMITVVTR